MNRIRRDLLWFDCTAAFIAGAAVLLLSGWLSALYRLPRELLVVMSIITLVFGTFSFSLARRRERPAILIRTLIFANASWAVVAAVLGVYFATTASVFGLLHFAAEVIFVGGLAMLEWSQRDRLKFAL